MTFQEIYIQTLSEVFGMPKQAIEEGLSAIRHAHPGGKWDEEIPDKEAKELLARYLTQAPEIHAWFLEGAKRVANRASDTCH